MKGSTFAKLALWSAILVFGSMNTHRDLTEGPVTLLTYVHIASVVLAVVAIAVNVWALKHPRAASSTSEIGKR